MSGPEAEASRSVRRSLPWIENSGTGTTGWAGHPRLKEPAVSTVKRHKIHLSENEMPTRWYNILHDLPTPPPPYLHPGTGQPVGPDDLAALFPMDLSLIHI